MLTLRDLKADTELVAKDFQGSFFHKRTYWIRAVEEILGK